MIKKQNNWSQYTVSLMYSTLVPRGTTCYVQQIFLM